MTEVLADNKNQNYRLIQITDSHLFGDRKKIFQGLNTFDTLSDVVSLVLKQEKQIDLVLCTGDLAQDATIQAYHNFVDALAPIKAPQLWIPGNHDIRSHMQQSLDQNSIHLKRSVQLGNWRIIMLNSNVEGHVYGLLGQRELADLGLELADSERNGSHVVVCVHHNCLPVQAAWLQQHCLKKADELFSMLDSYNHVRGILYGHIHQEFESSRNNVKVMATPSTCIQFHPTNNNFTIDNAQPGYRWLDLCADGSIESGVSRVSGKSYNIDYSSTGY